MAKSRSKIQTVTNGHVSLKRQGIMLLGSVPTLEASMSEQDRSLGFLRARFKRDKTYDN